MADSVPPTKQTSKRKIENTTRFHHLTSNFLWTIRALFFGLFGGLAPTIFRKSSSTSSFKSRTAKPILSFAFTLHPSFICDEEPDSIFFSSFGAVHAALLVRRFQGQEFRSSPSKTESLSFLDSVATPISRLSVCRIISVSWWELDSCSVLRIGLRAYLLGMSVLGFGSVWNCSTFGDDRGWREEGCEFGGTLMHLRNLWSPHCKHGKEKLCKRFDLLGGVAMSFQSLCGCQCVSFSVCEVSVFFVCAHVWSCSKLVSVLRTLRFVSLLSCEG